MSSEPQPAHVPPLNKLLQGQSQRQEPPRRAHPPTRPLGRAPALSGGDAQGQARAREPRAPFWILSPGRGSALAAVGRCSPRAKDAYRAGQRRDAFPHPGHPEPQRWSRVGARRGTSVSDAGGARGAATAGARRRGPGRPHVRAAGAAAAAGRAARGGVWGKPPPAAGTAELRGRSPESGWEVRGGGGGGGGRRGRARGATGTPRPGLGGCQQGVARARRPRVAGLGGRAAPSGLALGDPGAGGWKSRGPGRAGEARCGKVGELGCSGSGRAADLHPEAARSGHRPAAR